MFQYSAAFCDFLVHYYELTAFHPTYCHLGLESTPAARERLDLGCHIADDRNLI